MFQLVTVSRSLVLSHYFATELKMIRKFNQSVRDLVAHTIQ